MVSEDKVGGLLPHTGTHTDGIWQQRDIGYKKKKTPPSTASWDEMHGTLSM
jgi:hypothetical protein